LGLIDDETGRDEDLFPAGGFFAVAGRVRRPTPPIGVSRTPTLSAEKGPAGGLYGSNEIGTCRTNKIASNAVRESGAHDATLIAAQPEELAMQLISCAKRFRNSFRRMPDETGRRTPAAPCVMALAACAVFGAEALAQVTGTGADRYGVPPAVKDQIESIARGRGSIPEPPGAVSHAGPALPDLSGKWRVNYDTGSFDLELRQNGSNVDGGQTLRGTLNGNVVTGTFSDLFGTGPLRLTFSLDGKSFTGVAEVRSQVTHLNGVSLGAIGVIEPGSPQAILRQRARLDEVQRSNAPPEEQAWNACQGLFAATYNLTVGGTSPTWTTSFPSGSSLRIPPFFSARGISYVQVRNVDSTLAVNPLPAEGADRANGFEFTGTVTYTGTIYRSGSDKEGWTEWKDVYTPRHVFAVCDYRIRRGEVIISATDQLIDLGLWKLSLPATIPPG
jgi:hypothetical protein